MTLRAHVPAAKSGAIQYSHREAELTSLTAYKPETMAGLNTPPENRLTVRRPAIKANPICGRAHAHTENTRLTNKHSNVHSVLGTVHTTGDNTKRTIAVTGPNAVHAASLKSHIPSY